MKGFVLAAGFGQRMRPLTESVPKPLLPVGNLPIIAYSLKLLANHGITDVIVNLHHLGKQLREALGDGQQYGVTITYSEEAEILGTGGGLKKVCEQLADEPFVVLNGDTILDLDLGEVIAAHMARDALATMVLREDPSQAEFGQIETDQDGWIRRILGQGQSSPGLRPFMFAGVHVISPRFLEYIPPDVNTCIVRYAYTKALDNNEPLLGIRMDGYWHDAGTPERYFEANVHALTQHMPLRHADPLAGFAIQPKRAVDEVVRLGADVNLGQGVDIRPPVIVGDGVRVGDNAVIGPYCVIGAKVQVGKDARVARAVLLDHVRIENEARVEDVIVGRKASLPIPRPAQDKPAPRR